MRTSRKKFISMMLAAALSVSAFAGAGVVKAASTDIAVRTVADGETGSAASGSAASGTAAVVSGPAVFGLNLASVNRMVGSSFELALEGIPTGQGAPVVTFSCDDPTVAAFEGTGTISTDYTRATIKVNLLSPGKTVIRAKTQGQEFTCDVSVVAAISEADFGWYHSENFISFCKRMKKKKKWVWAFQGEWGTPEKYGSTYRGIKIGMTLADVIERYGEQKLKSCSKKKDKFLYEKGFNDKSKKLKVKNYVDLKYGKKYVIRIYFTPEGKVFGFNMVMNYEFVNKMSLSAFGKSLGKQYKLI